MIMFAMIYSLSLITHLYNLITSLLQLCHIIIVIVVVLVSKYPPNNILHFVLSMYSLLRTVIVLLN